MKLHFFGKKSMSLKRFYRYVLITILLGQHRTILRVEARRPVFWQVKQKCSRILCVFASISVTVAGKSASEATLKASAVNCAVLP